MPNIKPMPKIKKSGIKKFALPLVVAGLFFTCELNALADTNPAKATNNTPQIKTGNAEFVYKYLLGEIAGQRGELSLASQLFLDLANQTKDARLAERATRAAAYGRQPAIALKSANLWADLDPDSLEAQQAASQLLVASGNLKEAKPHIAKLLAKEDMRANGFMFLNTMLENQTDKNEVFQAIKELAQPYPNLPEAHFAVAQAAWIAGKPDISQSELKIADGLRPGWEASAQMQGEIALKDSPEKALAFFKSYLDKYPKSNEVRLSYAKLLVNQKRYAEAKPELVKIANSATQNPDILAVTGLLALEMNELSMAENYLKQALNAGFKDPEQMDIYLGRVAERSKNDKQALEWYNKVGAGEHYLNSKLLAANVIARTKGADAAITMLDEVSDLTTEQQIVIVQTQASLLAQAKRAQESFDLLEKAVNNMPNTPDLVYDYAMAAERLNKLDLMETELRKVIQIQPDYAAAYNALGYSFADRNIKLNEAKTLIETALKLSPEDHYMLDSLGWVEYRLGNLSQAAEILHKAYDIQADPEIAAHLGEVLWKQGLQEEAKKIWASALQAFPENDVLVSTKKKFQS